MAIRGEAFLAVWTGIQGVDVAEYDCWFVHEHFGERVHVKGFNRGRRYQAIGESAQPYFMLYDVDNLDVLTSSDYQARLNNPSPCTKKMMPHMHNFLRAGCRVVASEGLHVGGTIASILMEARVEPSATAKFCEDILAHRHVVGVHIGEADPRVSLMSTGEKRLRRETEKEGNVHQVCMIESCNRAELIRTLPDFVQLVRSIFTPTTLSSSLYELSCLMP